MSSGKKDICLVVPTIRENSIKQFAERWESIGLFEKVDLMLMEDNPEKTFEIPQAKYHFDWVNIDRDIFPQDDSWIIPRRSDTVRSAAYFAAWHQGYEYILTLDDDCYPPTEQDGLVYDGAGFVEEHLKYLTKRNRWFNTLTSVKPRGIPFYNLGEHDRVMVNHGLWTNVLDYDAPYQLANPIEEQFAFDNRIVPSGLYFPMCGMNVMWKSDVTVLMYHLLMGQQMMPDGKLVKLPFDRFGDIWCGIFMKKILDMKQLSVSTGMPYIRHERASNPFANLKKEANGIEVNEKLWNYVDEFNMEGDVRNVSFSDLYAALGRHIGDYSEYPEHARYFEQLGKAMETWAKYFREDSVIEATI